jgi:hypothetical protein
VAAVSKVVQVADFEATSEADGEADSVVDVVEDLEADEAASGTNLMVLVAPLMVLLLALVGRVALEVVGLAAAEDASMIVDLEVDTRIGIAMAVVEVAGMDEMTRGSDGMMETATMTDGTSRDTEGRVSWGLSPFLMICCFTTMGTGSFPQGFVLLLGESR